MHSGNEEHFTPPQAWRETHARARAEARAGLYVHVPFCSVRCTYCDFSSGALSRDVLNRYLSALETEMERRAPQAQSLTFSSVFFGGGTPSALPGWAFRRIVQGLRARYAIAPDAEFTLEANPESVRDTLLDAWAEGGVNRLSMGAQTSHADELQWLGRIHAAERPAEALALARAHGFRRLSLDLMFAFPGHTLARWEETLDWVLSHDLEHVSAYAFIPEVGTPLGDAVARRERVVPDDDTQAAMYQRLVDRLAERGLHGYETSNFCRNGGEARHNLVYWLRRPYLALGPSAHGFVNGERYGNHYATGRWAAAIERGELPESEREGEDALGRDRELLMLGLRLGEGLAPADHDAATWRSLTARYGEAWRAASAGGRLERTASGGVRIPSALRFVADDVIAWIDARADLAPSHAAAGDDSIDTSIEALAGAGPVAPAGFDTHRERYLPSMPCQNSHSPAA